MLDYFKHQANIDLTNALEPRAKNSRTYLGFHLDELTKVEQSRLLNLIYKKGLRLEDNGGYGVAVYYEKVTP